VKRRKQRSYTSEELKALWPDLFDRAVAMQKGIKGTSRAVSAYIDSLVDIVGGAMRMAEEDRKKSERLEDAERLNKVLRRRIAKLEREIAQRDDAKGKKK